MILWFSSSAPEDTPFPTIEEIPQDQVAGHLAGLMTDKELLLAIVVVLLGVIAIVVQHVSLRKTNADASEYTKATVLALVIVGTLITVVAGFSAEDIAPAMGLFGTIAGYVIGANRTHSKQRAISPPPPVPNDGSEK